MQGFDWPNADVPVALVPCEEDLYPSSPTAAYGESKGSSGVDKSFQNVVEAEHIVR